MLGLEHDLLLRDVEQRGRPERRADAEQRQRRVLRLLVLAVEHLDAAADVQALEEMERKLGLTLFEEQNVVLTFV